MEDVFKGKYKAKVINGDFAIVRIDHEHIIMLINWNENGGENCNNTLELTTTEWLDINNVTHLEILEE